MNSLLTLEPNPSSQLITRRQFAAQTVHAVLAYSLIELFCTRELFAAGVNEEMTKWLKQVNDLADSLKKATLDPRSWQSQIETLFGQVNLPELLKFIDFDRIDRQARPPSNGAQSIRFDYPAGEGVPTQLTFGQQIFALRNGRSVVPHGHNNMATAFLILKGEFQGKHYDRLEDEPEHIIIKPTMDRKFSAGECSTVSDYKDNVHWFKALSQPAYILNIHILGVAPDHPRRTGRVYLDPNGHKLAGGLIRARRINEELAHKLYG